MKTYSLNFTKAEWFTVIAVALGYYFDAYDLLIFSSVRKISLIELGIKEADTLNIGLKLLNWQLVGLVLGGVLWGVLADKFGRRAILFGSIITYSLANIANSMVTSVEMYTWLRFIAGIGLAGELGVGISLITENIPKEKRTYATTIVSFFGMLGAASGGLAGTMFSWQICYLIGGIAGFFLLILRLGIKESDLYIKIQSDRSINKGNILTILKHPKLLITYILCTLAGSSSFLFIGMFIQSTPEFGKEFGISISAGIALVWYYVGSAVSELCAGIMSKAMKLRKSPMYIFYAISLLAVVIFCLDKPKDSEEYYLHCAFLGFGLGYWTLLITSSAEQFGTNIRATAATSIPNVARAWNIPFTTLFKNKIPQLGLISSAFFVGIIVISCAIISLSFLKETFETDANFIEK